MRILFVSGCLITLQYSFTVHGLSFKAPLSSAQISAEDHYHARSWKRHQKPLNLGPLHRNGKTTQLPITNNFTHEMGFFTNIGIGNPPQYFSVLVDISAADSFIQSIKSDLCSRSTELPTCYNSSASSTYRPNDTSFRVDYGGISPIGFLSQDTLTLGNIKVTDQIFQEAVKIYASPSWDDLSIINGVLGLTPSSEGSVQNISNPFINAVSQGLLDHNLFTLKLAAPGQLTIGDIDRTLFTGNLAHIPLTQNPGSVLVEGRWQVEAKYLAIGPYQEIKIPLDGYSATFTTMWSDIYLPDRLAVSLIEELGFEESMFMSPSIDCDLRGSLPDITINLGGHDLVLSPFDYTKEWEMARGQKRCVTALMPSEFDESEGKQILLGSAFLQKFYTVFDLDSKTVAFANLA